MKKYVFWFHYNKPLSKKRGKTTLTIHYKKQCIFVDNIVCKVPTSGKLNKTQPRFVVAGKAKNIKIENGVAYVD